MVGVLIGAAGGAHAQSVGLRLSPGETCGGYPALAAKMAPGLCAGLVVKGDATARLRMPRTTVQIKGSDDWLIADLGGWDTRSGAIWRLTAPRGKPPVLRRLLGGLEAPHTVAIGPDGRTYVGEMGRIFAFDPNAADPASTILTVVAGLPDNKLHDNRHPLSAFLFTPDGSLLVNVGAPSDQCLDAKGRRPGPTCPEGEAGAVVRRYAPLGPGRWSADYTVYARGLRNSMTMVMTPSGAVLQAENSIDLADPKKPFDEINLLEPGRHYGWPYCMDATAPTPGWRAAKAMDCRGKDHTRPVALLTQHSAPLGMIYYDGAMFPALRGKLLVALHGYRQNGGRIVAYDVNKDGIPIGYPLDLTPGWNPAGPNGRGQPVGLAVASDGAILVCDDRNGVVIRLAAR